MYKDIAHHSLGKIERVYSDELKKYVDVNTILISKGSEIPCKVSETISTSEDHIVLKITQGEDSDPDFVDIIKTLNYRFKDLSSHMHKITIRYEYNENQIFSYYITEGSHYTGMNINVLHKESTGGKQALNNEKISKIINQELKNNTQDEKLWHKSMVLMGGDKEKAKEKYHKLRSTQIKKEGYEKPEKDKTKPKKTQSNLDDGAGKAALIFITGLFVVFILGSWAYYFFNINSVETNKDYVVQSSHTKKPVVKTEPKIDIFSLKINTEPKNAMVKILNYPEKYEYGIKLIKGTYDIEISYPGYISETISTDLDSNYPRLYTLQKKRPPNTYSLNIKATPSDATIKILNIKPKYHQDIFLKEGKYLIEVSKKGYDSEKRWVNLDADYTGYFLLTKKLFADNNVLGVLTLEELRWCLHEEESLKLMSDTIEDLSATLNNYSKKEVSSYNRKIKKLNKKSKLLNTRCKDKQYRQSDYDLIKKTF